MIKLDHYKDTRLGDTVAIPREEGLAKPSEFVFESMVNLAKTMLPDYVTLTKQTDNFSALPENCAYMKTPDGKYLYGFIAERDEAKETEMAMRMAAQLLSY
jgi:hypothetical protein